MKIIKNCWNSLSTYNCQYGAHIFRENCLQIYVNHWLVVPQNMVPLFSRKNAEGFVGHCVLSFNGVQTASIEVTPYSKSDSKTTWHTPVLNEYKGENFSAVEHFAFEGSLLGFSSSVLSSIYAQDFELIILEKNEPAREN